MNNLTIDDLPNAYKDIAYVVGYENFIALCQSFGGCSIYIPTKRKIEKPIRDRLIKEEFDGSNIRLLCKKFDICETQIRKILFK